MAIPISTATQFNTTMKIDIKDTLEDIRERSQTGLIPQLLQIQKHQMLGKKSFEWVRDLQCLLIIGSSHKVCHRTNGKGIKESGGALQRTWLSNYPSRNKYVAVSYRWNVEGPAVGEHEIRTANGRDGRPSKVQGAVWDRVISYAKHYGVRLIWIDKECIPQEHCDEKEIAMQSMDLVYSFSQHPLGLLFTHIDSQNDLELLQRLLRGELAKESKERQYPVLKWISYESNTKVLRLLEKITSDEWWDRAWIFQEEYCSSTRMCLLIPYSSSLRTKQAKKVFGNLPGELQVNSAEFRKETTVFCLAYRRRFKSNRNNCKICNNILSKAGKYNILLRYQDDSEGYGIHKSMSPTIFADIGSRGITNDLDILAIAANCCAYSKRLNTKTLATTEYSLSLCIFVLHLLNGEIVQNSKGAQKPLSHNVFEYLKQQTLDSYEPPVGFQELTFIKHCRFAQVRLCADGIHSTGYLWRLWKTIKITATVSFESFHEDDKASDDYGLNRYQRRSLWQLVYKLELERQNALAQDLINYLNDDASDTTPHDELPSKRYKDLMAEQVVNAIKHGNGLQLGCLVGQNAYSGIFISSSHKKSYVFTSWSAARPDLAQTERNIDKYVSLEVDVVGRGPASPRLKIKRWMNGLCFFNGRRPKGVVFPWPVELAE